MYKQFDLAGRHLLRRCKSRFHFNNTSRHNLFNVQSRFFHPSFSLHAPQRDLYEVLGVDKKANEKDIKQAFFKKAKQFHPDTNPDDPNATDKFAEVNEAYQILSDSNKRREYDTFGSANNSANQGPGFGGGASPFDNMNMQDIFEQLFGMGAQTKRQGSSGFGVHHEPGDDVQVQLSLSFEEAMKEVKRDIRINIEEKCGTCSGSGAKPGTTPKKCAHCNGSGMMSRQQGFMIMQQTCPYCMGEGVNVDPCNTCDGRGLQVEKKTIAVTIPAGVDEGMRVRIPNQGSASRSKGGRGHLYVLCSVSKSNKFERDGADIHLQLVVPLSMAILGGEYEIQLPNKKSVTYKIASGTQSGHIETFRGKGFPNPRNGMHGHLYTHISVHIPSGLDAKSRELMQEFKENEIFREPRAEKPNLGDQQGRTGRHGFRQN